MKVSVEILYHLRCDKCQAWWSIGDRHPQKRKSVFCPDCGHRNEIEDFQDGNGKAVVENRLYLTESRTPNGVYGGPNIVASSFEQAELKVLEIKDWLNSMGLPDNGLKVIGKLEDIIPAD